MTSLVSHSFTVKGLRCNNCANGLTNKLNSLDDVTATVSFANEKVMLTCPESSIKDALTIIEDAGYQLLKTTERLTVIGWRCSGCSNKTISTLNELTGISEVVANSATQQLTFTRYTDIASMAETIQTIQNLGYTVTADSSGIPQRSRESWFTQYWRILFAIILTLPLIAPMLGMLLAYSLKLPAWLEFSLASIVQFAIGSHFYRGAWQSFKNKQANMDTLVVMGTSAAYFYSCYVMFISQIGALYFETSAVIITFVTIGKWLEDRAKQAAGEAMKSLLALKPEQANLLIQNKVTQVAIERIAVGDIVRVMAGGKVPADGLIITGCSELDESMISGEHLPVTKSQGDKVFAGAINTHSVLDIRVNAIGQESHLQQIIDMVEQAQSIKAPIEKLVDKVSGYFVPVVLLIAIFTFFIWFSLGYTFETALINSVAVLVVACPCALGLATPAAIVVGSGVAAKQGIVIRNPSALQIAGHIDTVAFDKTGTLTLGKPQVSKVSNNKPLLPEHLSLLAALVSRSDHPLSKAIAQCSLLERVEIEAVEHYQAIAGQGVVANSLHGQLLLGNRRLLAEHSIEVSAEKSHHSVVYFVIDHQLIARFDIEDELRNQSVGAIAALKKQNIKTLMLSGDNEQAVASVAKSLAIHEYHGVLQPQDKLAQLLKRQQSGQQIAMVGDGINDAPALAQANLGIAMGGGTQTAINTAQITLMQDNPLLVSQAITIAKNTWRTVKQNLVLAFLFNTLAIPAAAMGYLTPQLAGLAMALSSVTVLLNALSLKRTKIE